MAEQIKEQIREGQFGKATDSWGLLEDVILAGSNSVVSDQPCVASLSLSLCLSLSQRRAELPTPAISVSVSSYVIYSLSYFSHSSSLFISSLIHSYC